MDKFILMDCDGVINVVQDEPIAKREKLVMLPFVQEAFFELEKQGAKAVLLRNDHAMGEGLIDIKTLGEFHGAIQAFIGEGGGRVHDILVCPCKRGGESDCAYPNTGLLTEAARKHGLVLAETWLVCAGFEALQAGWRAGCKTAFVRTGKPFRTMQHLKTSDERPDLIERDLLGAALRILRKFEEG